MNAPTVAHRSRVIIDVGLDAERKPVTMEWEAAEGDQPGPHPCQSFVLSLWDRDGRGTGQLHLWTHDMQVDEMHRFVGQTLHALAESYGRATGRKELGERIRAFGDELLREALEKTE